MDLSWRRFKMKTTINIPEDLMEEVQRELNIKNKTTLIIMGLQELINQSRIRRLRKYRGTLNLEIDLDLLRERKDG
jgi:Arc/MetJ family transcription regulator